MRTTLRLLALVGIILASVSIGLFYRAGGISYLDPSFAIALATGCGGFLAALATFIVALVAAGQRRQFGWMTGAIAVGVFALLSPLAATVMVSVFRTTLEPTCAATIQYPEQCVSTAWQTFALNSPMTLALIGPLLVGLIALAYSFGMRATPVAAPNDARSSTHQLP